MIILQDMVVTLNFCILKKTSSQSGRHLTLGDNGTVKDGNSTLRCIWEPFNKFMRAVKAEFKKIDKLLLDVFPVV